MLRNDLEGSPEAKQREGLSAVSFQSTFQSAGHF